MKQSPRRLATVLLMLVTLAMTSVALAQGGGPYAPLWFTFNSGGVSTGGGYTLRNVIGQAEAGLLSGGGYTLRTGFGAWPGTASTGTPTATRTPTATFSPSTTLTPTSTPTATRTMTLTPTRTPTRTATPSPTPTETMSPVAGDPYEPDDECSPSPQTLIPSDGMIQVHTFHRPLDVDWVTFSAISGTTYLIEVQIPPDSLADVALELNDRCGGLPQGQQDHVFTPGVRMLYRAAESGLLHLQLSNHDASVAGAQVIYQLSVRALADQATPGAVIIVAGRLTNEDPLQPKIHHVTNAIRQLFLNHGYGDERIYYLATDQNLPGSPITPTVDALRLAITEWAPNFVGPDRALTIYLVDHGVQEKVYLDKPNNEWVTSQQMNRWLDILNERRPGTKINVIIEACHSGSFVDLPETVSQNNRVVITSTNVENRAWASEDGAIFSDHFLEALDGGASLLEAFSRGRWAAGLANQAQASWLDGNGNGIPNEAADEAAAAVRGFTYTGSFLGGWPPYVVRGEVNLAGSHSVIRAEVRDDEKVRRVWAVIYGPSYTPPGPGEKLIYEVLPTAVLFPQGNGWYAAEYAGFTEPGLYRVVVYAEDDILMEAQPRVITVVNGMRAFLPMVLR